MNTPAFTPEHPVVSREEWLKARKELLLKEKEFTRLKDRLCEERRALPWVKVEKNYLFDTDNGRQSLAELFEHRSQLIVQHFMFGPGWKEGCVGCSFGADHNDSSLVHLENHDVSLVAVSRAPLHEIKPFQKRMGWKFRWVSSFGSDFNYDYHVSFTPEEMAKGKGYHNYEIVDLEIDELPGTSVFYKDENGTVFHTYSSFGRGAEELTNTYNFLDLTPKGRNETGPAQDLTDWVRHHDRYGVEEKEKAPCACSTQVPETGKKR